MRRKIQKRCDKKINIKIGPRKWKKSTKTRKIGSPKIMTP